ncbi:MAG: response regulator [Promethearchaeota archaeon]
MFIVEDDKSIQLLYEKFLTLSGFQVIGTANNGEEGVHMFNSFSEKPDIILMDHRMPIKNGIEATKEIFQIANSVKIIFVSADKTIKQEALSLGIAGFLEKPFSLNNLVVKINDVLSSQVIYS